MVTEIEEIMEYLEEKKKEPYIDGYYYYNRVQLLPDDIMYISIAKRGSHIHICSGTVNFKCQGIISCRKKVEELYEILKDFNFVYAHNSYIVNLRYIKSRTKNEIQLMNGEVLTVSRSRTKELKEKISMIKGKTGGCKAYEYSIKTVYDGKTISYEVSRKIKGQYAEEL